MALMRCASHPPEAMPRSYVTAVQPLGFPDTALLCSANGCERAALIWLEEAEKNSYDSGNRIFSAPAGAMKVRAV